MIAVYRQLGGPELPSNVERFAYDFNRIGSSPEQVVGESMSALGMLQNFAETFPAKRK
jgi:hypothetical protein